MILPIAARALVAKNKTGKDDIEKRTFLPTSDDKQRIYINCPARETLKTLNTRTEVSRQTHVYSCS